MDITDDELIDCRFFGNHTYNDDECKICHRQDPDSVVKWGISSDTTFYHDGTNTYIFDRKESSNVLKIQEISLEMNKDKEDI